VGTFLAESVTINYLKRFRGGKRGAESRTDSLIERNLQLRIHVKQAIDIVGAELRGGLEPQSHDLERPGFLQVVPSW
jgi:hypothetical protein